MEWIQALVLGLIQGITEFLPISSDGHFALATAIFGIESEDNLLLIAVLHGATTLSILFLFWRDIFKLLKGLFSFRWNEETIYSLKIIVAIVPVAIVGLFFKDIVEGFFAGDNLVLTGSMLILTGLFLSLTYVIKPKQNKVGYSNAFVIGIAQAFAVLPGLSRSGSTIATGLMLGISKEEITKFSFLIVIIPILGDNFLSLISGDIANSTMPLMPLLAGFIVAFVSGIFACKFLINMVRKGKLIYFAIYCFIVGIATILLAW